MLTVYDLQPGDLAVLNQLVYVTDWCGIMLGAAAGAVLAASSPLRGWQKHVLAVVLFLAAYQVINIWA